MKVGLKDLHPLQFRGAPFEAWPAVLEIGDLDAESSDVLIETLELANEGHRQTM